jgi:hypothetical protein
MSSLQDTNWIISMNQFGTPVTVPLKFKANGVCSYGPYDNCTYTEQGSSFVVLVPTNEPPLVAKVQLAGTCANGVGEGVLTHIPSPHTTPDGIQTPFTMLPIQR